MTFDYMRLLYIWLEIEGDLSAHRQCEGPDARSIRCCRCATRHPPVHPLALCKTKSRTARLLVNSEGLYLVVILVLVHLSSCDLLPQHRRDGTGGPAGPSSRSTRAPRLMQSPQCEQSRPMSFAAVHRPTRCSRPLMLARLLLENPSVLHAAPLRLEPS